MRLRQLTHMATHMAEQQETMVKEVDGMIKEARGDVIDPLSNDDTEFDDRTSEEGTTSDAEIPAGAGGVLDVILDRPSTSSASSSNNHDAQLHPAEPATKAPPEDLEAVPSSSSLSPKRRDVSYALVPIEGIDDGFREAMTGALQARLERRKLGYFSTGRPVSRHTSRPVSRATEQTMTPLMFYESLTHGNSHAPFLFSSTSAASVAATNAAAPLQPLDPSYWADYDDLGPSISQQPSPRASSPEPSGKGDCASPPGPPQHGWAFGPLPPRDGSPAPRRRGGTPKSRPGSRQKPRNFRELEQQASEQDPSTAALGKPTSAPRLLGRSGTAAADAVEPFDLHQSPSKEERKRIKDKEQKEGKYTRKLNKAVCRLVMDGMLDALEASEAPLAVVTAQFGSFAPEGSSSEQLKHQSDKRAAQQLQMLQEILADEHTEQDILSHSRGETPADSPASLSSPTHHRPQWGAPRAVGDILPGGVPESPPRDKLSRSKSSNKGLPHQRSTDRIPSPSPAEGTMASRMLGVYGNALEDPADRPATAPN